MTPQLLGRYQLLREIASGGMATVYAARSAGAGGFQKLVAVKRMLPHMTSEQRFKDMFLDEARLTANIRSPYAVATLDLGEADDGSLFLVMDLVIGASFAEILRGCIKQGRVLPVPAVTEIMQQAARGLHDAHEATSPLGEPLHIVHRDVSPQNILVGIDGASRITDFGVAHALERLTKTKGRDIKGKLAYCSPEQARGDALDARSDVFALGIVLWEGLTHRRLFRGESTSETISALLSADIPDPRSLRPEVPEAVAAVVLKSLQRNADDRYQSALDFAEALRGAVSEHVRTEDLRDLVKLIAGESIAELVDDIRAAIESSSVDASRSWDDAPTRVERSPPIHRDDSDSEAATLEGLKQTGQFLAQPPSKAMMAASTSQFETAPSLSDFSSSYEGAGPKPVKAPKGMAPAFTSEPLGSSLPSASASTTSPSTFAPAPESSPAASPPWRKLAVLFVTVCLATVAVSVPVFYVFLRPATSASTAGADASSPLEIRGLSPVAQRPTTPIGSPIAPAPPVGLDVPVEAEVILSSGFEPPLWSTKGNAGGAGRAQELSPECTGYLPAQPQHVIELEADIPRLRVFVQSDFDTSLVVRSSSGSVSCADDSEGLNPVIDEAFEAGRYEVFVASALLTARPEYTLGISETPEFSPRSFEPPTPAPTSMRFERRRSRGTSMSSLMRGAHTEIHDPWVEDVSPVQEDFSAVRAREPAPAMDGPAAPILR